MGIRLSPLFLVLLLAVPYAQGETDLDVTMRMVPDDQPVSDSVVRRIELPDGAADRARENTRKGLERAGSASGKGREALDRARERAREGLEQRPGDSELPVPGAPGRPAGEPGSSRPDSPAPERPDQPKPERPEQADPR